MPQFRKKPVMIEAWRTSAPGYAPPWLGAAMRDRDNMTGNVWVNADGSYSIQTLEGVMRADVGDWIIQGVKGELYPCKPDIFAATYEAM